MSILRTQPSVGAIRKLGRFSDTLMVVLQDGRVSYSCLSTRKALERTSV